MILFSNIILSDYTRKVNSSKMMHVPIIGDKIIMVNLSEIIISARSGNYLH